MYADVEVAKVDVDDIDAEVRHEDDEDMSVETDDEDCVDGKDDCDELEYTVPGILCTCCASGADVRACGKRA